MILHDEMCPAEVVADGMCLAEVLPDRMCQAEVLPDGICAAAALSKFVTLVLMSVVLLLNQEVLLWSYSLQQHTTVQ